MLMNLALRIVFVFFVVNEVKQSKIKKSVYDHNQCCLLPPDVFYEAADNLFVSDVCVS